MTNINMNTYSRFSVLSPEVDLDSAHRIKIVTNKNKNKKENKCKENEILKPKNTSTKSNNPVQKKKKTLESDLQALAFGFGRPKGNKKSQGNNNNNVTEKSKDASIKNKTKKGKPTNNKNNSNVNNNDEDWRKRDEEFIKIENERSLREAILQSKLEFEENKEAEKFIEICTEKLDQKDPKGSKAKSKKKKPVTLSLSQFNNLQTKELTNIKTSNKEGNTNSTEVKRSAKMTNGTDEKFFKDVEEATRKTLDKEIRQEKYEEYRLSAKNKSNETQLKKLASEIEKRDYEIQALRLEVDSLRSQLQDVKARNKKLCEVISYSEMRSKGELIMQLEKVTKSRDEFSEEIATLTAGLEQERTKVSHLTMELKKLQEKKRTADSSSK